MIALTAQTKVFLADCRTDQYAKGIRWALRAGHRVLQQDPQTGHLFLFLHRRRDKLQVLYWDDDGLAIWYRRIEQGTFQLPKLDAGAVTASMSSDALAMLLRGVDENASR